MGQHVGKLREGNLVRRGEKEYRVDCPQGMKALKDGIKFSCEKVFDKGVGGR